MKIHFKTKKPELGDKRKVRKFALLPTFIPDKNGERDLIWSWFYFSHQGYNWNERRFDISELLFERPLYVWTEVKRTLEDEKEGCSCSLLQKEAPYFGECDFCERQVL